MSRSREIGEAASYLATQGRRNLIINGGFDVWQRGTSFTGGYTADRWTVSGTTSVDQNTTGSPTGFTYNMLINRNVAGAAIVAQRIEGKDAIRLVGKNITASFRHVADTGVVNSIDVVLSRPATTEDDFSTVTEIQRITLASIQDLNTVVFSPLPAEVSLGLQVSIEYTIGAAATWRLTGVQLEAGDTATPFEQRSYGEELTLCQRYYEYFDNDYRSGIIHMSTGGLGTTHFQVVKRVNPNCTSASHSLINCTSAIVSTGYVTGFTHYPLGGTNNSYTRYALNWIADAEL